MLFKNKSFLKPLLLLSLFSLLTFISGHLSYLLESEAFSYVHLYIDKAWCFLLPLFCAWLTITLTANSRAVYYLFLLPFVFSFTSVLYYLPYRYEYLILYETYGMGDAILISLVFSVVMLLDTYISSVALVFITLLLTRVMYKTDRASLGTHINASAFDLSVPLVGATLILSVSAFILSLVAEIVDTVTFLCEAMDTVTTPELITMVTSYLLLIALSVLSHLLLVRFSRGEEKNI